MTMASLFHLRTALVRTARPCSTRALPQNVVPVFSSSFSTAQSNKNVKMMEIIIPSDATTTAGQVLHSLNTLPKQDALENAHIQALVESCDSPSDYPKLLHAITTFKRTRRYIMDTDTANVLVDKVLSISSNGQQAEGPLWILENFKPRTGLYYSVTVYKLDKALNQLYTACQNNDNNNNNNNDDMDNERVWKALQHVSSRLIQRKTLQSGRGLKKRAKKEYVACLQTKGGPTQHFVRRVAEIAVTVKGGDANAVDETVTTFIQPFQAANVSIHPATLEWLQQQKIQSDNEEQQDVEQEAEESEEGKEEEAQSEDSTENQQEEDDKKE